MFGDEGSPIFFLDVLTAWLVLVQQLPFCIWILAEELDLVLEVLDRRFTDRLFEHPRNSFNVVEPSPSGLACSARAVRISGGRRGSRGPRSVLGLSGRATSPFWLWRPSISLRPMLVGTGDVEGSPLRPALGPFHSVSSSRPRASRLS